MSNDFQRAAGEQGRDFEASVCTTLKCSGWKVVARRLRVEGAEVDIVATDPYGEVWWIECKGSWEGIRQGSKRTDTVKKAVGTAWYLSLAADRRPYMLVTSHLPDSGIGKEMLDRALEHGLFARITTPGGLEKDLVKGGFR